MADQVASLEIDTEGTSDETIETWFASLTITSVFDIVVIPISNSRARIMIFYDGS